MTTLIRERFSMAALDASGSEPKWNLIIPVGKYHGATLAPVGGSYDFTPELFAEMVENWKANGAYRIPVRWGHEHEENEDPAKAKELDRKAGNITDLRVTAAGLEGLTAWNDAGRKDVVGGEFDGWSAEFRMRHLNRLTGTVGGPLVTGVALTNRPFFNLMPPVAASADADSTDPNPNKEHDMSLVRIAAALGLSATATEAEIVLAAEKKTPGLTATDVKAITDPMQADFQKQLKAAQDESAKLAASLLERDLDKLIATAKSGTDKLGRAIDESKLKPQLLKLMATESEHAAKLKCASDFLEAIPLTVPKAVVGVNGVTTEPGTGTAKAAQVQIDTLVAAKMKDGLSFKDAHRAVGREHKELATAAFAVPSNHAATAEN